MRPRLVSAFGLGGSLRLRVFRKGRLIEEWEDRNLCVQLPRERIARLIAEGGSLPRVTKVQVGTNGTAPSLQDTAITEPFEKPVLAISYPAPGQVQFHFAILSGDANGKAIREFGLVCEDGTLFARKTRGVIEKDADVEIEGSWTIHV